MRGACLALLAQVFPLVQAAAQAPSVVAPAASPQSLAKARQLLTLVNPFAKVLEANLAGWDGAARKSLSLDPSTVKLEKDYPGISAAALDAARPLARKYLTEFVRTAAEYKADLMAHRLTEAELDEALRFFASDAGRKAISGLFSNADPAKIGADIAVRRSQTGQAAATAEDVRKIAEGRLRG